MPPHPCRNFYITKFFITPNEPFIVFTVTVSHKIYANELMCMKHSFMFAASDASEHAKEQKRKKKQGKDISKYKLSVQYIFV